MDAPRPGVLLPQATLRIGGKKTRELGTRRFRLPARLLHLEGGGGGGEGNLVEGRTESVLTE